MLIFSSYSLLIKVEPYWNVNLVCEIQGGYTNEIKVEPYWNVNKDYLKLQKENSRLK